MNTNIVCIVQARMNSTRLPGKVLKPILHQPMIAWVIHRLRKSRLTDQIVIATSDTPADDAIVDWARQEQIDIFRGDEQDVLDRYVKAAQQYKADVVVRITADCPFIDPCLVDLTIATFQGFYPRADYVSLEAPDFPRGLDVEVVSYHALENIAQSAIPTNYREHVTYAIARQPARFRTYFVRNFTRFPDAEYRWTVDTINDLHFVQEIYQHFGHGDFYWQDILKALEQHPEWIEINQHIEQKYI